MHVTSASINASSCKLHQENYTNMTIRVIQTLVSRRQLHVISRSKTTIKPASPTPLDLKQYNLPLHDRLLPHVYVPIIFFYPKPMANATIDSNLLKNTLSETLSKYYPFAGRVKSGAHVECNDEGVHFLEARIGCKLPDILDKAPHKGEEEGLGHLFPPGSINEKIKSDEDASLVIQLSHFNCGGIAVAVSLSHRLGDASTLCSFVNYWATLSRGDHQKLSDICPRFVYDLLPQSYFDNVLIQNEYTYPEKHCWITKKILFHNSNIAKLKAAVEIENKLEGAVENQYTRNEVVTALLYRCASAAASNSPSVLWQVVNMRPMIDTPLPHTSVGNILALNHIPTNNENDTKLYNLLGRIKKGKMQLRGVKSFSGYENMSVIQEYAKSNRKIYIVSSLCNYKLYDNMDFGWGRPIKATFGDTPEANCIFLMDTPGGDGIEAIVSLEEKEMEKFQANKELLRYAYF